MERKNFRHELAQQLRVDSVRSSAAAGSGHPTSSMSAAELMAVLLDGHLRLDPARPDDPGRDHLIFSKGHASPLFYACLKAAALLRTESTRSCCASSWRNSLRSMLHSYPWTRAPRVADSCRRRVPPLARWRGSTTPPSASERTGPTWS